MKKKTLELFKAATRNANRAPKRNGGELDSPRWFNLRKDENGVPTIYIYGTIDPYPWWDDRSVSASDSLKDLDGITADEIHVRINSEGGSVFDGVAIYNLLREHDAKIIVHVDSLAASIASVIAMAGDEIIMSEAAQMMIHPPSTIVWGNADELEHEASILRSIQESIVAVYARSTGQKKKQINEWMDSERWMTGEQAVKDGFADRIAEEDEEPPDLPEEFTNLAPPSNRVASNSPSSPSKGVDSVTEQGDSMAMKRRRFEALELQNK